MGLLADKNFNPLQYSDLQYIASYSAADLEGLISVQEKIAVCLSSLYRENTLPDNIASFIPKYAEEAYDMAKIEFEQTTDIFTYAHNSSPERLWPAFLVNAVLVPQPINESGLIIDRYLTIEGNFDKAIFNYKNKNFSLDEMNLQIDAAALCFTHLKPFIKKCLDVIKKDTNIQGPLSWEIFEHVYDDAQENEGDDLLKTDTRLWLPAAYENAKGQTLFETLVTQANLEPPEDGLPASWLN